MRTLGILLLSLLTGCASLRPVTQRVRVVTDPAGASVAALEDDGRKELGAAPVEYRRSYEAYHCSKAMWLLPVVTALVPGGAGFGVAYGTSPRPSSTGDSDRLNSGLANGALFAALGLALGIGITAECLMKDGEVPEHKETRLILEASKDGFRSASAPLRVPSPVEEIRLALPPAPPAPDNGAQ